MWISEDAAKTSVRADISCQVFAYTKTEEASGIARLQSKYNLGNKRRDVQTEFLWANAQIVIMDLQWSFRCFITYRFLTNIA